MAICIAEVRVLATCAAVNFSKVNIGGLKPSSGGIDTTSSRSRLGCTKACSEHSGCRSVFYVPSTKECQRHNIIYTNESICFEPGSSAEYYEKHAPTTPCSPQPFTCPSDNVGVKTMWLSDCSVVNVSVFSDITRSFPDAKAKCEAEGGKLYEVTTAAKMIFSISLMNCSAYTAPSYWIDGVYNLTTSVWKTTDGIPLPMTEGDFWYPARPNAPGSANCVQMNHGFNLLWDDGNCTVPMATICDMP